jgi:hypothetical protein
MSKHYTPQWKDRKGNVMIFPARNTLFDEYRDASDWQLGQFIFMVPFGLSPAGILEFDAIDGKAEIVNVQATLQPLGECRILSGPDGPGADGQPSREG